MPLTRENIDIRVTTNCGTREPRQNIRCGLTKTIGTPHPHEGLDRVRMLALLGASVGTLNQILQVVHECADYPFLREVLYR